MTRNQQGVALIEFALILPLLLLLTFITTEFGRAIYQYDTLAKSVRNAARYLSIQTPNERASMDMAKNLVVYGNIEGTGQPLALGLELQHVWDPYWQPAGAEPIINTVTIEVRGYRFNSLVSGVFGLNFGTYMFAPIKATMRSHV
jgi:hypothetical protein